MNARRKIITLAQLLILAAAGWGLYQLSKTPPPPGGGEEHKVQSQVAVHFGQISVGTVHRYVTVYGTVAPEISVPAEARVTLPIAALVSQINCVQGQRVEKGQTLFTLDSRAAEIAVDRARVLLAAAKDSYDKYQSSNQKNDDSAAWYLSQLKLQRDQAQTNLDAALQQQTLLKIPSPLAGIVVNLPINPGEVITPGMLAADIIDLDRLVIDAAVPSSELSLLKLGQSAQIIIPSTQPTIFSVAPATMPTFLTGTITIIDPQVDPRTGMGSIDISLPKSAGLLPGQFVSAKIIVEEHRDCLTVPAEAIVTDADGKSIIDIVEGGAIDNAIPVPVQLGLREGDTVEVHGEGLGPHLAVVTTGAYSILERTRVFELDSGD